MGKREKAAKQAGMMVEMRRKVKKENESKDIPTEKRSQACVRV